MNVSGSGQLQDQRDADNVWLAHFQAEEDLPKHASGAGDVGEIFPKKRYLHFTKPQNVLEIVKTFYKTSKRDGFILN